MARMSSLVLVICLGCGAVGCSGGDRGNTGATASSGGGFARGGSGVGGKAAGGAASVGGRASSGGMAGSSSGGAAATGGSATPGSGGVRGGAGGGVAVGTGGTPVGAGGSPLLGSGGAPAGAGGTPTSAALGCPVAFYTDLVSAPPGAYVTLWGRGFGATRGSSTVTLSGIEAARYVSWSDGMIELQIPADATSGALVVHNACGNSPDTALSVHSGRSYFVAQNGNDSWSGTLEAPAGGDGPFQSLTRGRDALRAGDVLYVRSGTFTEVDAYSSILSLRDVPTGTATAPVALVAYPGEVVTLGDNTVEQSFSLFRGGDVPGPVLDHLVIAKFHLRPQCNAVILQNGSYGRLVGNEVTGAKDACGSGSGTIVAMDVSSDPAGVHDWQILGNFVHDNGNTKFNHGVYLGGYGTNSGFEIAWNRISEQIGGRGIQIYGHRDGDRIERVSVHDNEFSETDRDGLLLGGSDASGLDLSDVHVFNNLFWRTGRCEGWGVSIENATATGIVVESNTFYDNGAGNTACHQSSGVREAQLQVTDGSSVVVRNNLFAAVGGEADAVVTAGSGVVSGSNNLYSGSAPSWDTHAVTGAAAFVAAASADFHLGPGSAAIDAAAASAITVDHDGIQRPQGAAPDIGAYEATP